MTANSSRAPDAMPYALIVIGGFAGYWYLTDIFLKRGYPGCTVMRGMTGFSHE